MFNVIAYADSKNISRTVVSADLPRAFDTSDSLLSSLCLNTMDLVTVLFNG